MQQKVRRKDKKIKDFHQVIKSMKKEKLINEDLSNLLATKFSGIKFELMTNEVQNINRMKNGRKYSADVFEFAHTLHFLSPKAYEFARKHLTLPDKSTLRRHQTADGRPGWSSETLTALKNDASITNCILIMDAIHLKSHVDLLRVKGGREIVGYVDYGAGSTEENGELATEALTLMVVGLHQPCRMPLAYFLTNGPLNAEQQHAIIVEAIHLLHDSRVRVRAVVCDGTNANLCTLRLCGAEIPLSPFFKSPVCPAQRIYACLDVAHMIKLSRNCFAKHDIKDSSGNVISWQYISDLFKLQEDEGLKLANKLSRAHVVEWQKRTMKVKLATQVLSRSVAMSLEFLKDIKVQGFQGSEATIRFILLMNE